MDPKNQSEDQLVATFARLRRRGEDTSAVWDEIVTRNCDRIEQQVKRFRFPGGDAIHRDRIDDAVIEACAVMLKATFKGSSIGELRVATQQWVWNACMDYGRKELRHDKRYGGSVEERWPEDAGGDTGRYDAAVARYYEEIAQDARDKEETEEELSQGRDLLAWAIGQVENESYREVLELTYLEKLSGDEIAARLDINPDNVYQRRRRGNQKLEEILRDLRGSDPE